MVKNKREVKVNRENQLSKEEVDRELSSDYEVASQAEVEEAVGEIMADGGYSVEVYDDELDPSEDRFMFKADYGDVSAVMEVQRTEGSSYKVGLFGNLRRDADLSEEPVDEVEVRSYDSLEDLAKQLFNGYQGPTEDPLGEGRAARLESDRDAEVAAELEKDQNLEEEELDVLEV